MHRGMEKCPKVNNPLYCGSRVKNADAAVAPVLWKKNIGNVGPFLPPTSSWSSHCWPFTSLLLLEQKGYNNRYRTYVEKPVVGTYSPKLPVCWQSVGDGWGKRKVANGTKVFSQQQRKLYEIWIVKMVFYLLNSFPWANIIYYESKCGARHSHTREE